MTPNVSQLAVAFLAVLAPSASAFWRLPCSAPIVVQRSDPIVTPGKVAAHVHTIMGGNAFGFDMTYADTQKSTCSSCLVTKDFSNYWVPQLYYKAKNGTFIDVKQAGGGLIYYLQRSDPKDPEYSSGLLAFPEGFRMLAGNPYLRSYTDTVDQQAVNFACLGIKEPETHQLPDHNCPGGLRTQIFFPSCWDGVNLDSPDHKSHMAYPSRHDSGFCPPSHPKRFISLFYEVVWNTPDFANMWYDGHQPFVFATGDDTGYGYHGDFVNGWDVPTLQRAVNECTALSGVVEDCHVFEFFGDDVTHGCKIPASVDEQVFGVLDALPGCNPVQSGPAMAQAMKGCGAPTTIGTPQTNYVDMTVSKGFAYLGCGTDSSISTRTLNGATFKAPDMTNEKCVDFCVSKGFSIAGTEYTDECYCGNSILKGREPVPGLMGNCIMPCAGDQKEFCGGRATMSLYQKCGSTCQNIVYTVNNSTTSSGSSGSGSGTPPTSPSGGSGSSSISSNQGMAPTHAPSTKSDDDHKPSTTKSDDDYKPSTTKPADSDGHAPGSDVVVVVHTKTVVPLESVPTPIHHDEDHGACGATYTVTVAVLTVTVTAPQTYAAMATHTEAPEEQTPVSSSPPKVAVAAVMSSAPSLSTSSSAPYALSNETSSTHHHGTIGSTGHAHLHAHATHSRRHY